MLRWVLAQTLLGVLTAALAVGSWAIDTLDHLRGIQRSRYR